MVEHRRPDKGTQTMKSVAQGIDDTSHPSNEIDGVRQKVSALEGLTGTHSPDSLNPAKIALAVTR